MTILIHNRLLSWSIRIALLAAAALFFAFPLIVPSGHMPEMAYRLNCAGNLKQIAMACKMYRDDHGGVPESFLGLKEYLPPGRIYVCPHYYADHSRQIVKLEKNDREQLLYTSYDYLGPNGESDRSLGEVIVVREKIHHPPCVASDPAQSRPTGHHVITHDLKVKFISDEVENTPETEQTVNDLLRMIRAELPTGWTASYDKTNSWLEISRDAAVLSVSAAPNSPPGEPPEQSQYAFAFRVYEAHQKSLHRLPDFHFRTISLTWGFNSPENPVIDITDPRLNDECTQVRDKVLRLLSKY